VVTKPWYRPRARTLRVFRDQTNLPASPTACRRRAPSRWSRVRPTAARPGTGGPTATSCDGTDGLHAHRGGHARGRDLQRRGRAPAAVYSFDIVAGPDRPLWFTTNTEVGRITTAGQITLWRVPGAQQLGGIAVAPDGSLWLADAIRHFVPPRAPGASWGIRLRGRLTCAGPGLTRSRHRAPAGRQGTRSGCPGRPRHAPPSDRRCRRGRRRRWCRPRGRFRPG
jgi:hypothetical protein